MGDSGYQTTQGHIQIPCVRGMARASLLIRLKNRKVPRACNGEDNLLVA